MTEIPDDLKPNTAERGPYGTELMGVSVALPLAEMGSAWDRDDWAEAIRIYQPEMLDMFRRHIGGVQPATMPTMTVDGPHDDPLQGLIYVMTCGAWVDPTRLPPDCTAYIARNPRERRA